nr:hypothetical protein GCM10020092_047290 [Actinoplanes digitatis]
MITRPVCPPAIRSTEAATATSDGAARIRSDSESTTLAGLIAARLITTRATREPTPKTVAQLRAAAVTDGSARSRMTYQ